MTSLGVLFLSVAGRPAQRVDWEWLDAQPAVRETATVRHLRLPAPLLIRVDGASGRGVVLRHD
jgi:hypothetical protein